MTTQEIEKVLNKQKKIHQQFIERKNINLSYSDLLLENFTPQQAQQDVITLSHCKCCSRHQINKPKSLTDRFQYPINEKDVNFYDNPDICKCTCRHVSRALCFCYHN